MVLTEAKAREKWCPTVRFHGDNMSNRDSGMDDGNPGMSRCIGSRCMAWRWSRAKETKSYLDAVQAYMKEHSCDFAKANQKVFAELGATFEEVEGYCGLAGKP